MPDDEVKHISSWAERELDPEERRVFREMRKEWEWYAMAFGLLRRVLTWTIGIGALVLVGREGEVIIRVIKALW